MKKFVKVMAVALVAVMALAALVACGPNSDPDKALAALKDNGYTATKADDAISLGFMETALGATRGDLIAIVTGTKDKEMISILYFKDSSTASKFYDKAEKYVEDQKDDEQTNWQSGQSGALVYFGTPQAVKDAR